MRFSLTLLLAGLLASLTACQSLINEVDPDRVPRIDGKLVVQCYISPQDTLLLATISASRPVLGSDVSFARVLKVTLSEGNRSIEMKFNEKLFAFAADPRQFPIEAGKTYHLQVQGENHSVKASCTVPAAIPIQSASIDSTQEDSWLGGPTRWVYYTRFNWQDPPGQANYYRVAGEASASQWVTLSFYKPGQTTPDTLNRFVFTRGIIFFDNREQHLSDQTQDGQAITSPRGTLPWSLSFMYIDSIRGSYGGSVPLSKRPVTISTMLLHVDKNYYDYHRTLQQQDDTEGNPFAEPVLVSTNIEGGLGCFGAYNRSTLAGVLK